MVPIHCGKDTRMHAHTRTQCCTHVRGIPTAEFSFFLFCCCLRITSVRTTDFFSFPSRSLEEVYGNHILSYSTCSFFPVMEFIPTSALFFPRIGQNCHSNPPNPLQVLKLKTSAKHSSKSETLYL